MPTPELTDDEVDAALMPLMGFAPPQYYPNNLNGLWFNSTTGACSRRPLPFSDDHCPHSLRVMLVEAVVKAGKIREFFRFLYTALVEEKWEYDDLVDDAMNDMEADGESEDACMAMSVTVLLSRAAPGKFARAVLAALTEVSTDGN